MPRLEQKKDRSSDRQEQSMLLSDGTIEYLFKDWLQSIGRCSENRYPR